jgi:hypothetical protein
MSDSSKTKTKAKAKAKGKQSEAKGQDGQMSCLNAAAKVLAEKGEAMTCKEMIEAMAAKGYWTTPGGNQEHDGCSSCPQKGWEPFQSMTPYVRKAESNLQLATAIARGTEPFHN